uniref:Uncharacterized protein n=1 Tax=Stegastes partitus TaxID=144197 RepID=A0A3B4Z0Y3_9TELE
FIRLVYALYLLDLSEYTEQFITFNSNKIIDFYEQHLRRRYAESIIASEIGKIRASMVQKNFIDFLLSQKGKRSSPIEGKFYRVLNTLFIFKHKKKHAELKRLVNYAITDLFSHFNLKSVLKFTKKKRQF